MINGVGLALSSSVFAVENLMLASVRFGSKHEQILIFCLKHWDTLRIDKNDLKRNTILKKIDPNTKLGYP